MLQDKGVGALETNLNMQISRDKGVSPKSHESLSLQFYRIVVQRGGRMGVDLSQTPPNAIKVLISFSVVLNTCIPLTTHPANKQTDKTDKHTTSHHTVQ